VGEGALDPDFRELAEKLGKLRIDERVSFFLASTFAVTAMLLAPYVPYIPAAVLGLMAGFVGAGLGAVVGFYLQQRVERQASEDRRQRRLELRRKDLELERSMAACSVPDKHWMEVREEQLIDRAQKEQSTAERVNSLVARRLEIARMKVAKLADTANCAETLNRTREQHSALVRRIRVAMPDIDSGKTQWNPGDQATEEAVLTEEAALAEEAALFDGEAAVQGPLDN
jgi:hypothetical protein